MKRKNLWWAAGMLAIAVTFVAPWSYPDRETLQGVSGTVSEIMRVRTGRGTYETVYNVLGDGEGTTTVALNHIVKRAISEIEVGDRMRCLFDSGRFVQGNRAVELSINDEMILSYEDWVKADWTQRVWIACAVVLAVVLILGLPKWFGECRNRTLSPAGRIGGLTSPARRGDRSAHDLGILESLFSWSKATRWGCIKWKTVRFHSIQKEKDDASYPTCQQGDCGLRHRGAA